MQNPITMKEAQNLSGYSRHWLNRLARDGKLDAEKVATVWLVERESLERYLKRQRRET